MSSLGVWCQLVFENFKGFSEAKGGVPFECQKLRDVVAVDGSDFCKQNNFFSEEVKQKGHFKFYILFEESHFEKGEQFRTLQQDRRGCG
jgi:hypothetical protein